MSPELKKCNEMVKEIHYKALITTKKERDVKNNLKIQDQSINRLNNDSIISNKQVLLVKDEEGVRIVSKNQLDVESDYIENIHQKKNDDISL